VTTLIDPQDLLETVLSAVRQAGSIVRQNYTRPHTIRRKGPRDLVTETDTAAQTAAISAIRERYADHHILAEESPEGRPGPDGVWLIPGGYTWIIDPLDGTSNYTASLPFVSVSVGVALDGQPVAGAIYDPLRDELIAGGQELGVNLNGQPVPHLAPVPLSEAVVGLDWAHAPGERSNIVGAAVRLSEHCRTLRALGSAALALGYVALGRLHLYYNYGLQPWDTAAAAAIIQAVGGGLHRHTGQAWRLGEPWLIAGHPSLLTEVADVLKS
jgi:myo-inositol-1(or 4)-monophosphatase